MITFYDFGGAATIDGTQGSTNAGILAAVMFTVSGGVVTITGQKNVASITRHSAGKFRVNFNSTLANNNYGLMAGARAVDSTSDDCLLFAPDRNSSGGNNTYSTTQVDLQCTFLDSNTGVDPTLACVVIFDPASVGSDYLAAGSFTVSGTTPTLQQQTNITSVAREAAGAHQATFTSTLGNSDYSVFGSSRFADFAGVALAMFGPNRNSTAGRHDYSTTQVDLACGRLGTSGSGGNEFDIGRASFLVRNSDVAPRGTVAAVRFSVSGGVCTVVRQWNVASVTYQTTGCYRVNFTTPISDTDYALLACGRWPTNNTENDAPQIGMNRNSSASRNVHSANSLDIAAMNWDRVSFDPEFVDVWVVKPWLM